jgi:hypothetical protein
MNGISPFTLSVGSLCNLGADRAVELFRRLLWAEASRVGIGRNLIDAPNCINVGDGGIDAYIEDANPSADELIPQGTTGFQVKSSDLGPTACKRELHEQGDLNQPLKSEVKKILDNGGNYVLVLFADINGQQRKSREENLISELNRLGYHNLVRVHTANQLVGFAERFISIVTWFRHDLSQCLPYSSWAANGDVKTPRVFVLDEKRQRWIDEVRERLRNPGDECLIFRVTGLSGIGKTRMVFEALSPNDLSNRVIYVTADQFRSSSLYITLQNYENMSAVLVIDECDHPHHDEVVRSFSGRGPRLAFFTISHDIGNVPPPARSYKLDPLGRDEMEKILKAELPSLPNTVVARLSDFADGYPRIADLLAKSYLANAGSAQEYLMVNDDMLMDRLIGGRMDTHSDHFRTTKKVLRALSLFQKVGYEGDLSKEARWLTETINVDWDDFREIVSEQRQRGVIQGQYYIYITPFMLRVHLLREWWMYRGLTKSEFLKFVSSIPEAFRLDLIQRFLEHIPFISTTERGREFVDALLDDDGIFSNGELIQTEVGADFFLQLAQADPESALKCLKKTVGSWSREDLLRFTTGRRQVVWALEHMAIWESLFIDAARLLLALGEAENETWSNNASGVFAALFSPGYGPVAPTEASPQERFPVLQEALDSSVRERRLLGLLACDQALESEHFVRLIGGQDQRLRREPQRWMLATYGELWDTYRQIWHLLYSRFEHLPQDEQNQTLDILLRRARELVKISALSDMIIDALGDLAGKPYADKKQLITTVAQILHYDSRRLPSNTRQRLERLRNDLAGSDFSSLLKRYVGMNLLEDEFDTEGKPVDQIQPRLEELAQQTVANRSLLQPELDWLVSTQAERGHQFGYELGKKDAGFSLLQDFLTAQRDVSENSSGAVVGGYLRALYTVNEQQWEDLLDALTKDPKLNRWVPEFTWRSGMSDQAALRILKLAENEVAEVGHFGIFSYGRAVDNLSEHVFNRWIEFLIHRSELRACSIALVLYHRYYVSSNAERTLPEELTLKLLTHPSLFRQQEFASRNQMDEFDWAQVGVAFVQRYPERAVILAEQMLKYFGEDGTIVGGFHSKTQTVINEITRRYPAEVWKLVIEYLGPPIDSRAFHIQQWLRGDNFFEEKEGALSFISMDKIWEWVEENVGRRAWYLATFVPKTLHRNQGKICLAREVLVRYGEREDVRNNLMANFSTEGWSGPASLHNTQKKQQLLNYREKEDNKNVLRWIDEYITSLDRQIEYARIREEREGH